MYQLTITEIEHVAKNSNAHISDVLHLLDTAYWTIKDGIAQSLESGQPFTGTLTDNEWNDFDVTIIAYPNPEIMPHIILIDGIAYNCEYGLRVLACYLSSVEYVQLAERVVKVG